MRRRLLLLLLGILSLSGMARAECPPVYSLQWGSRGSGPGQFDHPTAGVTDATGNLYVVDSWNNRIQKFTPDGLFLTSWGSAGSENGQFNRPSGIAADASGNIYVADTGNSRIEKFSGEGVYLATIGTPGSGWGEILNPRGVAVDGNGNVYIADTGNSRVHKFAADGTFLRQWGPGVSNYVVFHSVSVSSTGQAYVLDTHFGRIYTPAPTGQLIGMCDTGGYFYQTHMSMDGQDRVHAPSPGHCGRIAVLDSEGGCRTVTYGGVSECVLSAGGGIALGPGVSYLIDETRSKIFKFLLPEFCETPPPPFVSSEPRILLHIGGVTSKNACTLAGLEDCRSILTTAGLSTSEGPFYYVYLIASRGPVSPLGGLQCGITYETGAPDDDVNQSGIDVFGWTLCATLEFITTGSNQWPKPGGGNLITWLNCPTSQIAVAGYFYVGAYSNDVMRIIPRPVDGQAKVATCEAAEVIVPTGSLGYISFGAGQAAACNPCNGPCNQLPIPVQRMTWSGIKTLY